MSLIILYLDVNPVNKSVTWMEGNHLTNARLASQKELVSLIYTI
jgi:hypothetical protein